MTLITGNTYPVRAQLAAMGGRWDATRKGWLVPDDRAAEARALLPVPATRATSRPGQGRAYRGSEPSAAPRYFRPCGYPGCGRSAYCDDCGRGPAPAGSIVCEE